MQGWVSFALVAIVALGVTAVWVQKLFPAAMSGVLVIGLGFRIVGSTARLKVLDLFYSGYGDSTTYFMFGSDYARSIAQLDFRFLLGEVVGRWWGTQVIRSLSGFVVLFTGESLPASFLVFSLMSLTGLLLCISAFGGSFGRERQVQYAAWVLFWPTLWFWPSSIGKEAVMLLAAGLTVFGYASRKDAIRWAPLVAGIVIASSIRPHVGAVMAASVVIAECTGPGSLFTPKRVAALLTTLAITAFSLRAGLTQLGLQDADLEGVQEHFEMRSEGTMHGGSQIELSTGWQSVPMGLITILMRPFPWEARGIAAVSAVEISFFWLVVFWQRRSAWALLKSWRTTPLVRFAVPFTLAMALMYGLAFANLGIIARQRAVILPFMLLFISAGQLAPKRERSQARAPIGLRAIP